MVKVEPPGALAGLPSGELRTPEAEILAEYALMVHDLEGCQRNMEALLGNYPSPQASVKELTIPEALFRDAVVQFAGCFGDAKKQKLNPEDVYKGDASAIETFRLIQDLRDAYAAHNFGPMRFCHVLIVHVPVSSFAVIPNVYRLSMLGFERAKRCAGIIETALKVAKRLRKSASDVVSEQIQQMGLEGILKLPPAEARLPDDSEIRMSRSQFRAGAKAPPRGQRGPAGRKP